MNDQVDPEALSDLLDGITERVSTGDEWGIGLVITGDHPEAGTAHHKGETMPREEHERRLEAHREEHGTPASDMEDTIILNVVEADAEPFEKERYGPEEDRPQFQEDASRPY